MPVSPHFASWADALEELVADIRTATRRALRAGVGPGGEVLDRPVGRGAGDWTFGLDVAAERAIDTWLKKAASGGPLSLLTEDKGWRHLGPGGPLEGFDHGGPRIVLDPVDGTRNLMAGLRSAWTVLAFAPPGPAPPRLRDLCGALLSELPTDARASIRSLASDGEACRLRCLEPGGSPGSATSRALRVDADPRPDHGYFPVFRFDPALRPALARIEADFFARLAREEQADLESVYDDQYISNGGQLFLTAMGTYRMIADARALLADRMGCTTTTSKPYDVAGAILCARSAGVEITAADGGELDFPLDAATPVHFIAWANAATRHRLEPHWLAALERWQETR